MEHHIGAFFAKILNGFKLLTILTTTTKKKTLHRKCSTGLKIGFWLRAWNIELTLVSSLQIKPKKYSPRKYTRHRFWKGERSWWDSKQNECLCWSNGPKSSFKKMLWEISHNSQEKFCVGICFLVFSYEFCEICNNTFFAEQHRTTASDYSSINSSEGSIGKRINCDTKINWSISINLSQKSKLLKGAVQVTEQVLEAVVRRLQTRCS